MIYNDVALNRDSHYDGGDAVEQEINLLYINNVSVLIMLIYSSVLAISHHCSG